MLYTLNRLKFRVNITFTCTEKPKNLLYCLRLELNPHYFWDMPVLVGPLYVLFWERSIKIVCPFFFTQVLLFFLLLHCMSSLYILDINPLSDICSANIFSHSVGCLFTLLIVSLLCRIFLAWCSPTYFTFVFFACAFGVISRKSLPR